MEKDAADLIRSKGYPVEEPPVVTEDGFLLGLQVKKKKKNRIFNFNLIILLKNKIRFGSVFRFLRKTGEKFFMGSNLLEIY